MRRVRVLGYIFAAVGGFALLAACSGGTDRESVTLEEYMQRVQTLHEQQEQRSEALGERLAGQFSGSESLQDALEAMLAVLPEFLPEYRSIIEETRAGLDALEPPADVRAVHADLLAAYADLAALIDDAGGQLARGEAGEAVLQTLLGERSGTALGVRFATIANALVGIADAAGIAADLSYGALAADAAGSDGPARSAVGHRRRGHPGPHRHRGCRRGLRRRHARQLLQ